MKGRKSVKNLKKRPAGDSWQTEINSDLLLELVHLLNAVNMLDSACKKNELTLDDNNGGRIFY